MKRVAGKRWGWRPVVVTTLLAPVALGGQDTGGATPIGERPVRAHVGDLIRKPDGSGSFFLDPNREGRAGSVRLLELSWGRLVDVHGLAPGGGIDPRPVFRELVINELIQTDGVNYRMVTNPATQVARLVVLRVPGAPEPSVGAGNFSELVQLATTDLPTILPKPDDAGAVPPVSALARNATLVARFDDLLEDSAAAAALLPEAVRIRVGYPPLVPFETRMLFDPNHGGIAGGQFHSTRVLIDMTVSEVEASASVFPLPINSLGLPASEPSSPLPNVSLRVPTRVDPPSGQTTVLTNLRGSALSTRNNGPVDLAAPTQDVVRGMRSGNDEGPAFGFLSDSTPPQVIGSFAVTLDAANDAPGGEVGREFLVDLTFAGPCQIRPSQGDVLSVGGRFLEVLVNAATPDASGSVSGVLVRLTPSGSASASELPGPGLFLTPFRPGAPLGCWVSFLPAPLAPPAGGVATASQASVRFSEPMRSASVRPFDTFRLVRGDASTAASPTSIVVAEVLQAVDSMQFTLAPLLPLAHASGQTTAYHLELAGGADGVVDLAGNALGADLPFVDFTIDPAEPTQGGGGVVLRFSGPDELEPAGLDDLRGQFLFDLANEEIRPRPVSRTSHPIDRNVPLQSLMIPFPPGLQAPLNPLGSKLQTVWRYADAGWQVEDETRHDLDVEGLSWVPQPGLVADFFPEFEIRLAHSVRLPDEDISVFLLPKYPASGLVEPPGTFDDNVLVDPASPQTVVHPRSLGYVVSPSDLFVAPNGRVMLPFPLNRGDGPRTTFTWRDTSVTALGGPNGAGIPLDREEGPPLFLEDEAGSVAPASEVPSFGLPLLLEFRTFPTDTGLGLNRFDVSVAINSSSRPTFRAFSNGGTDPMGNIVIVDPDLEDVASGDPGSSSLPADTVFYHGLLDVVTRVSRVITIWIDTQSAAPDYLAPVLELEAPGSSAVLVEYRGAVGFSADAGDAPFDATRIDPYGNLEQGVPLFLGGVDTWTGDIDDVDGARYVQVRFTFENDIDEGVIAALSGIGIAFDG